jgi:drug/metabolite transporter (DMT)-like permease
MLIGIIVGLHWVTFYGSIKMSNASVALICLATTSLFTSLIEPWVVKRKFEWLELLLGIIILPGMYFIVNGIDVTYYKGVMVGLSSALFASLFSILNKKYIDDAKPNELAGIQLFGVFVFITICAPFIYYYNPEIQWLPSWPDIIYLLILALLCTTFAYILSMRSLRHLSAFASNLVVNLEPVYGILLAAALLAEYEELSRNFYIGVAIICFAVFSYPILKKRIKNA